MLARINQTFAALPRAAPHATAAPPQSDGGVQELRQLAEAHTNALVAVLMSLDAKGWTPKPLRNQLQHDRWLP